MADNTNQTHTIGSLRESRPISQNSIAKVEKSIQDQKSIAVILARLATHYWRPDFTAMQAEMLFADILDDVREFSVDEIDAACKTYRRDAANKFFPKSGDIRALILAEHKHQVQLEKLGPPRPRTESRPISWWLQPRAMWKPHWKESEVPQGQMPSKRLPETPRYNPGPNE